MPNHPLDSARERLKRADENISNLDSEIRAFLAPVPIINFTVKGKEPIFTDESSKAFEQLRGFIISQDVSPRLGCLPARSSTI
jgi:hypothetical protein